MHDNKSKIEAILKSGKKLDPTSPYPVYLQLRNILKQVIVNGGQNFQAIPKETDICNIYGVSRDTVRNAISGLVEDGLLFRIKKKGTFINHDNIIISPKKVVSTFDKIGVLWPYSEVWQECIAKMEKEIVAAGYRPRVTSYPWDNLSAEIDLLQEFRETCAGIIVYPNKNGTDVGYLKKLNENGFPLVLVDMFFPDVNISYVVSDNFTGAKEAGLHLIEHGYKKPALFINPNRNSSDIDRRNGFLAALQHAGIQYDSKLELSDLNRGSEVDSAKIEKLILDKRPDAVFCAEHSFVYECFRVAEKNNISIPAQLALIAFDSRASDLMFSPVLSFVRQNQSEIGRMAAVALINLIEEKVSGQQRYIIPTELVLRRSCGCFT